MNTLSLRVHNGSLLIGFLLLLIFAPSAVAVPEFDRVFHLSSSPEEDIWLIERPHIKRARTPYPQITFRDGDQVILYAGGCVNTDGWGKSWKHYVVPKGPNSDRLYHGLVYLPNYGFMRIADARYRKFTIREEKDDSMDPFYLQLGYEDDDFGDNGYHDHDNGTGNQCKNIGPAWVKVKIRHRVREGCHPIFEKKGRSGPLGPLVGSIRHRSASSR